jgi:hypothetical protein
VIAPSREDGWKHSITQVSYVGQIGLDSLLGLKKGRAGALHIDGCILKACSVSTSVVAVRFAYEYHNDSGNWFRAYGNENWEFDENGLMRRRHASINDLPIRESERKFHWDRSRPRPADHPGLTDLGL